jgi:hypothetical protein
VAHEVWSVLEFELEEVDRHWDFELAISEVSTLALI